jgi:hypothetical protein
MTEKNPHKRPEFYSMATLTWSASTRPLHRVALRAKTRSSSISIYAQLRLGDRAALSYSPRRRSPAPNPTGPSRSNQPTGNGLWDPIKKRVQEHVEKSDGTGVTGSMVLFGAAMRLTKDVIGGAAYTISQEARREGKVQKLEDGEEVGESRGPWHKCKFADFQ